MFILQVFCATLNAIAMALVQLMGSVSVTFTLVSRETGVTNKVAQVGQSTAWAKNTVHVMKPLVNVSVKMDGKARLAKSQTVTVTISTPNVIKDMET